MNRAARTDHVVAHDACAARAPEPNLAELRATTREFPPRLGSPVIASYFDILRSNLATVRSISGALTSRFERSGRRKGREEGVLGGTPRAR